MKPMIALKICTSSSGGTSTTIWLFIEGEGNLGRGTGHVKVKLLPVKRVGGFLRVL